MQRYILTGAPGAGKTVLIRALELAGFAVVEEAATDLIALVTARGVVEHWDEPSALDDLVALQRRRQERADAWPDAMTFYDRSPICTLALCEFMGRAPPVSLLAELARIEREGVFEREVFLVRSLGFITPTEARRINLQDALRFEAVHEDVYRRLGYRLVEVPPASVAERLDQVVRRATSQGDASPNGDSH